MTTQSTQHQGTTMYKGKTLPMTLFPDENVLLAWEGQSRAEELIVTTHRVQLSRRAIGRRSKTNIMLDSITACSLEFRSRVRYIVLAMLSPFIVMGLGQIPGISVDLGFSLVVGIIVSVIFIIAYVRSRHQVVEFTTAGEKIIVGSSGRSLEEVRRLVETVEAAKNARYIQRFSSASVAPGYGAAPTGQA